MSDRDEQVRARAYALWQQDGEPHGRDQDYWHRAKDEIAAGDVGQPSSDDARANAAGEDAAPAPVMTPARSDPSAPTVAAKKPATPRRKATTETSVPAASDPSAADATAKPRRGRPRTRA